VKVDYEGFITTVKDRAELADDTEAQQVACATLRTLAERLSSGEADDIAERLPGELRSCLQPEDLSDRRFHVGEFLRRISARAGVDRRAAERDARAVFIALWSAVGPEDFADMRAELPRDYDRLLESATHEAPPARALRTNGGEPVVSLDEFLERVIERTGRDRDAALGAAEAVLEVLAIRITAGQAEDIAALLPNELAVALERGIADGGRAAEPLSDDMFIDEVARRAGVSRGQAIEDIRAVLNALRETLPQKEWSDTIAQLPDEYRPLMRSE
jgi:uncharacterized protein (DUF2267 family)